MLALLIREEVLSDLELAFNWYESEKSGLGDALLEEWENICESSEPNLILLYYTSETFVRQGYIDSRSL
jgi:hypothetical protein